MAFNDSRSKPGSGLRTTALTESSIDLPPTDYSADKVCVYLLHMKILCSLNAVTGKKKTLTTTFKPSHEVKRSTSEYSPINLRHAAHPVGKRFYSFIFEFNRHNQPRNFHASIIARRQFLKPESFRVLISNFFPTSDVLLSFFMFHLFAILPY